MSDYEFIRKRRKKFGGGIAFHINAPLASWNVKMENFRHIRKNKNLLPVIYKLANLSETDFTTNLENIISKLLNKFEKLILTRDFWETKSYTNFS